PGEGHLEALLRSTALGRLGHYGDPDVLNEAQGRFEGYIKGPASLHPDLRAVVYGLVAQEGGDSTYHTLWELEKKATLHEEKMRLLGALTRPRDRELLQETLQRSISEEVRAQDTVLVLTAVAANRYGRDLAWEFIKSNWDELDRRYGKGGFMIMRLVSTTQGFTTLERAEEVEQFFKEHPVSAAHRTVQQSLERIRLNAKWLERNRKDLEEWFVRRG
ncbi:MAG: ERAP1-like C-terminal domain-containing protein, partial [Dehalococcoidia bacterium]